MEYEMNQPQDHPFHTSVPTARDYSSIVGAIVSCSSGVLYVLHATMGIERMDKAQR